MTGDEIRALWGNYSDDEKLVVILTFIVFEVGLILCAVAVEAAL